MSFTQNCWSWSLNLFCGDWEKAYNKCVDYNKQYAKEFKQCVKDKRVCEANIQRKSVELEDCYYRIDTATSFLFFSTFVAFLSGVFLGQNL
jgi:hypothetical protein